MIAINSIRFNLSMDGMKAARYRKINFYIYYRSDKKLIYSKLILLSIYVRSLESYFTLIFNFINGRRTPSVNKLNYG